MANNFFNSTTSDIGLSDSSVYATPEGQKSIVIGCLVSNKTTGNIPVSVKMVKTDNSVVYLAKDARINGGESVDFMQGRKMVLEAGETIKVSSKLAASVDCIVSVLEGVS